MSQTLMADSPVLVRTISVVPTGHFMHNPLWMARTIFHCPKPVGAIEVLLYMHFTVKPVLSGHSKIDKTKVLMANGSLMKVKVLPKRRQKLVFKTDYSLMQVKSLQNAPIGAFCNTFDLH